MEGSAYRPLDSWIDHDNMVTALMILSRDEKRAFMRMNIESEISFSRSGSNQTYTGQSIDLSASGMRFTTQMPITVGETLAVLVNPGVSITPPLAVTLSVMRVIEDEDGQYDVAGLTQPG